MATMKSRVLFGIAAAWLSGCVDEAIELAQHQQAIQPVCGPGVQASITPAAAGVLIDNNLSTRYGTGNNNWQYVTIDLGCSRSLSGFRRNMVVDLPAASRTSQGEQWQYSTDNTTWTSLTSTTTFGWTSYVNYGATHQAWHSVNYGWSKWLRPNAPITARYVRYHWDGNSDSVAEVEVDTRTITSQYPGITGSSAWNAIDSDPAVGLSTGFLNWQYATLDLGRTVTLSRVRRNMSGATDRVTDGEKWSISSDGVTFRSLAASDVIGWEGYVNYGAANDAWRAVPYGWSAWLELKSPQQVRYIRFHWDGNSDALNELEFEDIQSSDPGYDFAWTSGGFTSSLPNLATSAPSTWTIMTNPNVGFSGFYEGELHSNVGTGQTSKVAVMLLQSSSGEVRGLLHVVEGRSQIYLDGLGCSNKTIPEGTRLNIRMTPSTNDGRFSEAGLAPPNHQFAYASGTTTRPISGFAFSGTATLSFYAQLWNKGIGSGSPSSQLTVYVDYATPCSDGPPLLLSLTRNNAVLRTMVGL